MSEVIIGVQAGLNVAKSTVNIQDEIKKIQESLKPLNISIDDKTLVEAFDKVSSSINRTSEGAMQLQKNVISITTEQGKLVQIIQSSKEGYNGLVVSGIKVTDNLKAQALEAEKLAIAMGKVHEQSDLRIANDNAQWNQNQVNAMNKAQDDAYLLKLKQEKEMENALLATEQRRKQEQQAWDDVQNKAINKALEDNYKLIETEKQQTIQLEKQIALFKEQKDIQLQNLSSQFGSTYKNQGIQSQVSNINSLLGVTPSSSSEFKDWSNQVNTELNRTRANLNTLKTDSENFGNTLIGDFTKMLAWSAVATAIYAPIRALEQGIKDVNDLNNILTQTATAMNTTVDKLGAITTGAQQMSQSMGANINDVLQIMHIYANVNETADSIMKKTKADVILSNVAGMNGTETTNTLQGIQQQFKLTDDQLIHVDDSLMKIASNLRVNYQTAIKEIGEGVKTAGTMAEQAGLSFEKFSSIIGVTEERTRRSGAEIGNAILGFVAMVA